MWKGVGLREIRKSKRQGYREREAGTPRKMLAFAFVLILLIFSLRIMREKLIKSYEKQPCMIKILCLFFSPIPS